MIPYPLHHKPHNAIVWPMTPLQVADMIASVWPASTVEVATDVLAILRKRRGTPEYPERRPMPRTWRTVVRLVCEVYDVPEDALMGRCRTRRVAEARHALFGAMHHALGFTRNEIARVTGRDWATVAYGLEHLDCASERWQALVEALSPARAEAAE